MRSNAIRNLVIGIILQITIAISGMFIPNLIISYYGSSVNGLIVSITQLVSYAALVEAGIGSVAIVALYEPLSKNDIKSVNATLSATHNLYKKSGAAYLIIIIIIGIVYPFIIGEQLDSIFVTAMFFIISCTNIIDYLFLGKYKVLLTADDKIYTVNSFQIAYIIINTVVTFYLIINHYNLLFVKLVSVILFFIRYFCLRSFCLKRYKYLSFKEKPNYKPLSQRWDSLVHQIAAIIVGNTDVFLITILMGAKSLLEVSVYSIYNMVILAISGFFGNLTSSLQAYFGKLYVQENDKDLSKAYAFIESLYYPLLFSIMSCTLLLILPFISLYTGSVSDVNYYRPIIACVFVFNALIQNIRIPGMTIILSLGKFSETKNKAIIESILNLTFSIILIPKFGIIGALIGTSISYLFRTSDVIVYSSKYIKEYSIKNTLSILLANTIVFFCITPVIFTIISNFQVISWVDWIILSLFCFSIILTLFFITNLFIFNQFRQSLLKIYSHLKGKKT